MNVDFDIIFIINKSPLNEPEIQPLVKKRNRQKRLISSMALNIFVQQVLSKPC